MPSNNLHIYPSHFTNETRMLKETKSLADSGLFEKIFIGAVWKSGLAEEESLDSKRSVKRFRLISSRLPFRPLRKVCERLEWMLKVFLTFRSRNVSAISCHCLAVLPVGLLFKAFCGSKIVYEAHELETERNGWSSFQKQCGKLFETFAIQFIDQTIVVGPSIARWYEDTYKVSNVSTVRNIPYRHNAALGNESILRKHFQLQDTDLLFLYQGVLGRGRYVESLLEIFSRVSPNRHIVFMGYGPLDEMIGEYGSRYPNIHFYPAVKPEDIVRYTSGADVGLAIFENTSLSYFFSSPNKLFEYVMCGVPAIISDFPDMALVIKKHNCGWAVPVEISAIEQLVQILTIEEVQQKKTNTRKASAEYGWDNEDKILIASYTKLFGTNPVENSIRQVAGSR